MHRDQYTSKIHQTIRMVANQYDSINLFRIWFRFGLITTALVLFCILGLYFIHQNNRSGEWLIVLFIVLELTAGWYFVYRPLRKPISLDQVALWMEEQNPQLENRLVSAIDFSEKHPHDVSPFMLEHFFQESEQYTQKYSFAELLDTDRIVKLFLGTAFVFLVSLFLLIQFAYVSLPEISKVQPIRFFSQEPLITFDVKPGNVRIRQGENQVIMVSNAPQGEAVTINWRSEGGDWQVNSMEASTSKEAFYYAFNAVMNPIEYQVQVGEMRSEPFLIETWLPPQAEAVNLVYHYPEYLGMEPKSVPNSGDINALEGTRVELEVRVNKKLEQAEMHFNDGRILPLEEAGDRTWRTELTLEKSGSYSLALWDHDRNENEIRPEYTIQVQSDLPPQVSIHFPRMDHEVTVLEEVPFEFEVTDDYGLKDFGLQYHVVGQEPVRVSMLNHEASISSSSGEYLIPLEEIDLQVGDLITWTVWAQDAKPDRADYEQVGEPYFLEIRPFKQMYREAISNQGASQQGQQQGQGQGQNSEAAEQKEVLIATWNLKRSLSELEESEYYVDRSTIVEAQRQVKNKVMEDAGQGGGNQDLMPPLMEAIDGSLNSLENAEFSEPIESLNKAIEHQQLAYRLILKMKPDTADVQQQQQQGGGGGGGTRGRSQESLQELEMNRQRNFYEEERSTSSQQQLAQADEALNKIKELAQRQQSIHEEIAKLISEMQSENLSIEEQKRRLERLLEEERRNLQRLDELERELAQRDVRDPKVQQAMNDLEETREQMNQSLEQMEQGQLQGARNASARALSSLDEMNEELQQESREAAQQRMRELQQRMNQITRQQQSLRDEIQAIQDENNSPQLSMTASTEEKKDELVQQKEQMAQEMLDLLKEADDLSRKSDQSQPVMSRKLGEWVRETSQQEIIEDIQDEEQTPLITYGFWEQALEREEELLKDLREISHALDKVAENAVTNDLESMQVALNNMRELLREAGVRDEPGSAMQGQPQTAGQSPQSATGALSALAQQYAEQQGEQSGQQQNLQQNSSGQSGPNGEQNQQTGTNSTAGQNGEQPQNTQQDGQQLAQAGGQQSSQSQEGQQSGQSSGQQGQQQGAQSGQQPGQQQGSQSGQQQGSQSGQQGSQGNQQSGQQNDQQSGQQGGQQSGQQQNSQSGQQGGGQQGGQRNGNTENPGRGPAWNPESFDRLEGWNRAGTGGYGDNDFQSGELENLRFMEHLMNEDFNRWYDTLQNVDALLPDGSIAESDVEKALEELRKLKEIHRAQLTPPKYDLFLEKVSNPLVNARQWVEAEIKRQLSEQEFAINDEGSIPSQYQDQVAKYFELLSEAQAQ